ncbi:hypothetical protein [Sphingobacterium sp. 1.A.5]|uniref:hypothetical protein n=1 Tax=Sphingobacterium sp. 1.A.5 TaxID=2044604 RepID=UPI00118190FE|nr:hypothetical protein [Sphingobacterium sp. 1.A.5]
MKALRLIFLMSFYCLFTCYAFSQDSKSLVISNMNSNEILDNLKRFSLENDYFIQNMDKENGFVQLYYLSKGKGLFTSEYRLMINIFVVSHAENENILTLQIKADEMYTKDFMTYYKDLGILPEGKSYTDLLGLIKQFFDRLN